MMLGEIAFDHPLFASLAGAQFNDFTKIRFWKYRHIDADRLGGSRVLARFENGDAAVIEKLSGKGRLVVLASGWQPADSQLARSSKFVPLMWALVEPRTPRPVIAVNQTVGDRVPIVVADESVKSVVVHKPDGAAVTIGRAAGVFDETDEPGLYTVEMPVAGASFAVNLDPLESKTAPLPVETIEQRGVRLTSHSRNTVDREQLRQMYNAELEGRQKLWRWLILAVIGLLIFETWLAGRTVRRRPLPRGGLDDMSTELRRALEQVATRFRHARLWTGLTVCWLVWALAGLCLWLVGSQWGEKLMPDAWLFAILALVVASGIASALIALRSVRDPRWVARRIEARHPELGTGLLAAVEEDAATPPGRLGYLQSAVIRQALDHRRHHDWGETVPTWKLGIAQARARGDSWRPDCRRHRPGQPGPFPGGSALGVVWRIERSRRSSRSG